MHELDYFDKSSFVTLTYNETKVPRIGRHLTLRKCELQLCMKRLRKACAGRKIKYYGVGEYGDKFARPHYHLIVFGVGDKEHEVLRQGPLKGIALSGPFVEAWTAGHVFVGDVTKASVRYVTDYIKKVYKGRRSWKLYGDCERPFQVVSQGLGKRYALDNQKQIRALLGLTVRGEQVGLPRYYRKVLDITQENTPEMVKRGQKAEREMWQKIADRVLKGGVPENVEAAMRSQLLAERRQVGIDAERKAEIRKKGKGKL